MTIPGQNISGLPHQLQNLASIGTTPPVESWNPPLCGHSMMRIAADGTWFHEGTPIGRPALVALFASILRRDPDGICYLVTPVEKCQIDVDDGPLFATSLDIMNAGPGQILTFTTSTGDSVVLDESHPLRLEDEAATGGLKPYIRVRGLLDALIVRAIAYDLIAAGTVAGDWFGVWSGGIFWPMRLAADIGAL